jgi:ABC-2 type transport system ATP-binding protein
MELLADDVVIIAAGRLVRQGPVEGVVGSMSTQARVRVRTPGAETLGAELKQAGATITTGTDGALLVTGVDASAVGAAALRANVELHELVTEKPDLEQVFLELTQGKATIR